MEVHDNLGTIVGAGIDTFWVPELPAPIQILLAVRLLAVAEELDPGVKHSAMNRVRDPGGEVMSEIGGEFAIGAQSARPEWLTGIMLATGVVFEAREEGTYTVDHIVDGAEASFPIHVVRGRPPGAETAA